MEFSLQTKGPDHFLILDSLPPDLDSIIIEGAVPHYAFGSFGKMAFQQIKGNGFSIWYSHYFINNDTQFESRAEDPVLELHFLFNSPVTYFLEGVGETILQDGQFNLTYTPFIHSRARLNARQTCNTFDIHFDYLFLQRFAQDSVKLAQFLERTARGDPSQITDQLHFATPVMMNLIRAMLHNGYQGHFLKVYLESQVTVLLIQVLLKLENNNKVEPSFKLSPSEVDRIVEARNYLLQNMDTPPTVSEVARTVGINDYKLKRGFKKIFDTTMFGYLANARLDKSRLLLLDSNKTIMDIGYELGYQYTSQFCTNFKRKFNCTPGQFRKQQLSLFS